MNHAYISKDWNIKIRRKRYNSCFREIFEPVTQLILSICFTVIVWTMRFFTRVPMQTLLHFKIVRMKLLFFPAMAVRTFIFQWTAIFIRSNEVFGMPILAHIFWIIENWRFPSIVLPVMCINTDISFMIIFSIRAPNSFEVENIEIHIWFKLLYQFDW